VLGALALAEAGGAAESSQVESRPEEQPPGEVGGVQGTRSQLTGLDWTNWTGLDRTGLDWTGLDYDWSELDTTQHKGQHADDGARAGLAWGVSAHACCS